MKASRARCSKDRLEVVDREREMVVGRGGARALEQVELQVAHAQPLHREPKVRRIYRLCAEDLDVEPNRILEVLGHDADVVDVRPSHRLTIARHGAVANANRKEC